MAIPVEDGTGLHDSETYISVSGADTYHLARGTAVWDGMTQGDKEKALRRATDYMIAEYRTKWLGKRSSTVQALDWPRSGVILADVGLYPSDVVPKEVQRACAELAARAATGELLDDEEAKIIEEAIGPIVTKYDQSSTSRKKYPIIDSTLRPFLFGSTESDGMFMAKLVRC